jgi:hypothetical protein
VITRTEYCFDHDKKTHSEGAILKGRTIGKKRRLRNKKVPLGSLGRGEYIVESMMADLCPDCQAKLIESIDPGLVEFMEDGAKALECPRCHWQGVVGGSGVAPPDE